MPILRCSECGAEFETNDQGRHAAAEHALKHQPLRYYDEHSPVVWIDDGALLLNAGPYKPRYQIHHRLHGYVGVEWDGPGWYVFHEYDVHYQNDTRHYREFRTARVALDEARRKMNELAEDLRWLRKVQATKRPS